MPLMLGGAASLATSCIRIEERAKYIIDIGTMLDELKCVEYVMLWDRAAKPKARRTNDRYG